ncbi:MAG: hypothetical protein ACTSPB_24755, partial [Candidatus Thorarchaeota archaeon]
MNFDGSFKRDYRSLALAYFDDFIREMVRDKETINVLDLPSVNIIHEIYYWYKVLGRPINHYVAFEHNPEIESVIREKKHLLREYIGKDIVRYIAINAYDLPVDRRDVPSSYRVKMTDIYDLVRRKRSRGNLFSLLNFDMCAVVKPAHLGIMADICYVHADKQFILMITSSLRWKSGLTGLEKSLKTFINDTLPQYGIKIVKSFGPASYKGGTDGSANGAPMLFTALACQKSTDSSDSEPKDDNKGAVIELCNASEEKGPTNGEAATEEANDDESYYLERLPGFEDIKPMPDSLKRFSTTRCRTLWLLNW